jgi:glycosyltransferase involved in cell wall biosynthesis
LSFVFVSKYFATEVEEDLGVELPADRYQIIHNPIDTQLFEYHPKPAEQRKRILSIRPFASRKYANDLTVKAILALKDEDWFHDLEFRIIGEGELFDELLSPLRDLPNVIIEQRFVRQTEIADLHRTHGIFLCPTRMDAQGVSRDEAMASGLVPITNNVAAIPEFVDGSCGVVVPPEDHRALAGGIARLVADPDLFARLSRAAADRVRRQSAADRITAAELAVLEVET